MSLTDTTKNADSSSLSPFSEPYQLSEPTSDELPDLGAFPLLLREYGYLYPPPRIVHHQPLIPQTLSTTTTTPTRTLTDTTQRLGSTVWNQQPIASYLHSNTIEDDEGSDSSLPRTIEISSDVGSADLQHDSLPLDSHTDLAVPLSDLSLDSPYPQTTPSLISYPNPLSSDSLPPPRPSRPTPDSQTSSYPSFDAIPDPVPEDTDEQPPTRQVVDDDDDDTSSLSEDCDSDDHPPPDGYGYGAYTPRGRRAAVSRATLPLHELTSESAATISQDTRTSRAQTTRSSPLSFEPARAQSQSHRLHHHHMTNNVNTDLQYTQAQPSLGYLDSALEFIAAERARVTAGVVGAVANGGDPGEESWRRVVDKPPSRRKRRRKRRTGPSQAMNALHQDEGEDDGEGDEEDAEVDREKQNATHGVHIAPASANKTKSNKDLGIDLSTGEATPKKKKRKKKPDDLVHLPILDASMTPKLGTSRSKASLRSSPTTPIKQITILRRPKPGDTAGDTSKGVEGHRTGAAGYRSASSLAEDEEDDEDENDEEEVGEEYTFSSSSNPIGSLHTHIRGAFKSVPGTPGSRRGTGALGLFFDEGGDKQTDVRRAAEEDLGGRGAEGKKRKRTRTKRKIGVVARSRSVPAMRIDTSGAVDGDPLEKEANKENTSKRTRLLALARKLRFLFPEERNALSEVIAGLSSEANLKRNGAGSSKGGVGRKKRGDADAEESSDAFGFGDDDGEGELDVRGRVPRRGDPLIHVFIDHSNILIGFLMYLKRRRGYQKPLLTPESAKPSTVSASSPAATGSNATTTAVAARPRATGSAPIPIPKAKVGVALSTNTHPIPLPSFATGLVGGGSGANLSRSLPARSVLHTYMASSRGATVGEEGEDASSDSGVARRGMSVGRGKGREDSDDKEKVGGREVEKRVPRHLWHAALALVLERGRPVSRRVIVTSSPLYQPMDKIERLGYDVRVYLRVPDLGDGMDRERQRDRDRDQDGRPVSGKSGPISSHVKSSSLTAYPPPQGPGVKGKASTKLGHARHTSGSTSADGGFYNNSSGSGAAGTPAGVGAIPGTGTGTGTPVAARIKYREQGVDELLQLKLHQALAATDKVPEGSTIVLATGDGNVGQFNEDGFLGPVRTALKRGWRVELYAWEDGLSRAWRREFGEGSEWGRRGMFRIIAMEPFAGGLVEAAEF